MNDDEQGRDWDWEIADPGISLTLSDRNTRDDQDQLPEDYQSWDSAWVINQKGHRLSRKDFILWWFQAG